MSDNSVRFRLRERARGNCTTQYKVAYPGDGYKCCSKCGRSQLQGDFILPFTLDHINGDYTDDRKENFQYVCPNCNSLLETSNRNPDSPLPLPRTVKFRNKVVAMINKGFSVERMARETPPHTKAQFHHFLFASGCWNMYRNRKRK